LGTLSSLTLRHEVSPYGLPYFSNPGFESTHVEELLVVPTQMLLFHDIRFTTGQKL